MISNKLKKLSYAYPIYLILQQKGNTNIHILLPTSILIST